MEIQMDIAFAHADRCIGRTLEVLIEGFDREQDMFWGRSYMDAPDIDTRVYVPSASPLPTGQLISARIAARQGYDLVAKQI